MPDGGRDPQRLQRLGELISLRRGEIGASQSELASSAGLSRDRWVVFEAGRARNPRPQTLGGIERALGWMPGSIRTFLNGGDEPHVTQGVMDLSIPGDHGQLLADLRRELVEDEGRQLRRQLLRLLADTDEDAG